MALDTEVEQILEEIRHDKEHSASWLSLRAIGALRLAAGKSSARTTADLLNELRAVARDLAEARPPMAPIANLVAQWYFDVARGPEGDKSLDSLRAFAILKGEKLIKARKGALNRVTEHGSQVVEDEDILMSCSDSATIVQSLKAAKLAGKEFAVYVTESRTGDGKSYGQAMADKLQVEQIPVKVIPDDPKAIGDSMAKSTRVMVGADSILDDGSLVNGSPTLAVAEAAKRREVPFYAVCEITKFSALQITGRHLSLEEGFEIIPPRLITRIITEEGIMKVEQAAARTRQMAGFLQTLWG